MIICLDKQVDMLALGSWLEANVGPVWTRSAFATPSAPLHTPYSKGRRWVIDRIYHKDKFQLVLEVDLRTIKPYARTDLLLRFSGKN